MKRLYIILLLVMACAVAHAQLVVTEFKVLETDMDARVNYPKKDQNGRTCAIIKVENPNKGFQFDTGTLQVIDRVENVGETWVYVQKGVRKITIKHATLGILRDYVFPRPLEEATTYLLKLSSGTVTTIVEQKSQVAYLIINSQPEGASVYINGEFKGPTPFRERRTLGESLEYRIQKKMYHDEIGRVEVNKTQTELNPTLRPAFGSLKITSQPSGAQVFVDDEMSGSTPTTLSTLASGRHTIRLHQNLYSPYLQEVEIEDGKTASIDARLSANFATLTITAPEGATITVDGQQAGTGRATVQHGEGPCEIEVTKACHRTERRQLNVTVGENQSVNIELTPITGTLIVDSEPFGAEIFIGGKSYGKTPNVIEKMLIGSYDITLRKSGYKDYVGHANVTEGKESEMRGTLAVGSNTPAAATTASKPASEFPDGPVDLGLSVKWASCNLGASKPEEYGDYYAWGETEPKSTYTWDNYLTKLGGTMTSLYDCGTNKDPLREYARSNKKLGFAGTEYDAAHVKLGGKWRMPTKKEIKELKDNTTTEWMTLNGVKGRKFTSKKNGNSIFLPAAGYRSGDGLGGEGSHGCYWSVTPYSGNASLVYDLDFNSDYFYCLSNRRHDGRPIRPVTE